ncbi:M20/M25/M40 family metallo-hydrolase [Actinoplanes sp. NPDC051851]|uniref:M20/M25/M40 family metallo-hydrolase n=1 Tax=Actinoplanes sp. NPDC051851 TaxID=3154753 RepID=UPI00342BF97C
MRIIAIPLVVTALVVTLAPQAASAVDQVNTKKLRDAVTVSGILGHERVLQRIADQNDGTRASGTPGFAASADYVKQTLKKAGYRVTEQPFTFPFFKELADPQLSRVSPAGDDYETAIFDFSGSGDVTGKVVPALDNVLPPAETPSSSAGCEPEDFTPASATEPEIALVQRGTCTFAVKTANAEAAGYDAVIIFNEGQEGRQELLDGTLGGPTDLPVVGLSFADGSALDAAASAGDVVLHVVTSTFTDPNATTSNIIADTPGGDPDRVIVVGAHLDSVVKGPGINDDGSGVALNLEIAVQFAKLKIKPRQKVRFAFWGAEESGTLGSEHYVATLPDADLARIYANLNFDMIASPNYVRFVYDGDGSSLGAEGPEGSGQIEQIFTDYFATQNLATDPTAFDGRSDYGAFIDAGIPAGGLFSGAEGAKTQAQAATYGGTAGEAYDSCYHQACDDISNLNTKAIQELGDGAAHAVLTLALTRSGLYPDGSLHATTGRGGTDVAPEGAF